MPRLIARDAPAEYPDWVKYPWWSDFMDRYEYGELFVESGDLVRYRLLFLYFERMDSEYGPDWADLFNPGMPPWPVLHHEIEAQ